MVFCFPLGSRAARTDFPENSKLALARDHSSGLHAMHFEG